MTYAIGLISGTSVDGIDTALVEINGLEVDLEVKLIAGTTYPYPDTLRAKILAVGEGEPISMLEFAELDDAIATHFARAAREIQIENPKAELIGSHGQTVFHRPPPENGDRAARLGYTLQLGRGELLASLTGLPVANNFRAADMAAGGQGAPLVSKIDACLLAHPHKARCVQNLGGIGNVTYLPARQHPDWEGGIWGWDTGPGNMLMDLAMQQVTQGAQTYDSNGQFAARGTPCLELIDRWLEQDFFKQPPPKSTGRELFGQAYLERCWQEASEYRLSDVDWLATLTELTAASVARSYSDFLERRPDEVLLCGGGSRNGYLKERLQLRVAPATVLTTDEAGLNSDYKEAIAFAVLGYWRLKSSLAGNLPGVTGATQPMQLGDIYQPAIAS
ncbi:anhydro-N-acetylmuramic acid kinase [Oscillatoria sp. FACHB-1406]|uniref:anhydro-N-acetylmuramic acid kinase n=1 Tax=Oscillatoria sp. FACHB-1406 TaxID=2692846 RepID=UPI0016835C5C|nr:anhydro-N-acetylmuramic acid kinase [Oscillatoria sp. FACHB-1406]MBD2576619.1 anhydro-N-acetylmuramic acid kinase [Oscillatoria sp. FACHB-1406]